MEEVASSSLVSSIFVSEAYTNGKWHAWKACVRKDLDVQVVSLPPDKEPERGALPLGLFSFLAKKKSPCHKQGDWSFSMRPF